MSLFGNPSSGAQSNNATTSSAPAPGGLFGSSTPNASGGLFGNSTGTSGFSFGGLGGSNNNNAAGASSTTPTTSLFGSKPADQKPLFGGATNTTPTTTAASSGGTGGLFGATSQTPPTSNLFGSAAKPTQSSNLFGSTPASTATNTTPNTAGTSGGMFNLNPGSSSTPATTTTSAPKPGGLFSGNTGGSSSLFAGANSSNTPANNSALQSTTLQATPAKPMFTLNSTTPAGAPPAKPAGSLFESANQNSSLFGQQGAKKEGQPANSLFPNTSNTSQATSAPPTSTSLFAGAGQASNQGTNLFAGAKPAESSPAPGGLFNNKPATAQGASAIPNATSSLFAQQPNKPAEATSAKPAGSLFGVAAGATPATSSNLFPSQGNAPSTQANNAGSTNPATAQSSLFAGASKPASAVSTTEPPKPQTSLFNMAKPASGTATTEQPKPTSSLFAGATSTSTPGATSAATSTPSVGASTSASATSGTAAPSSNTPAANSMFGAPKSTPSTENPTSQPAAGANALGASTAGPTSSMARLKNKTMDEIITRWATDLSKYQKEFKDQAAQVAQWDRLLVENGERIQKLYLETFEAEKGSREVERQLVGIESQQEELEAWLDKYESEVDVMFSKQIGHGEQLAGPDQEREKTYKLAEKITEKLDEMGRDLTKMIKEINDISGSLSKGNKPDDPLSQIVRVLNGHLTQLQWIDTNAAALQAKVAAAQKQSSTIGNQYGGPEQDNVDSFYRSYMGRR